MVHRNLIGTLKEHVGAYVNVAGFIDTIRDQKRMQFLILRDHTGSVQALNEKSSSTLDSLISSLVPESAVRAGGHLVANPQARLNGFELKLDYLEAHSRPQGPLPIGKDSNLDTRMDWRYIDLRDPKKLLIFKIQTTAEQAMRDYWNSHGFMEIHSPKLVAGASESGSELFQLEYFGQKASLAQSPQFYKQMAMSAGFDRVFEIGPVFRANPSFTSRHDTEFTSVDMEISWVDSHHDVMQIEEQWISHFMSAVAAKHGEEIKKHFGTDVVVPTLPFPRVTMAEAYSILDSLGYQVPRAQRGDLDPEGERKLAAFIKEKHGHDFVFVTDYPATARPFYHMRYKERPDTTMSFDLIWKGIEVTSGAKREHRPDVLLNQIMEKGIDPQSLESYVGFFKFGCPPHGGLGFGLSRMLMNITGLPNVREVTFVYRGPNRLTP